MKKENSNKDNNSPFKQFNFKFNFYWIYGIIFALLIGYQLLNSSDLASNKLHKMNLMRSSMTMTLKKSLLLMEI